MKNKKLTYILVPVVAVIWILIFLQIFNTFVRKEKVSEVEFVKYEVQDQEIVKDTFELIAAYTDPFLGRRVYTFETALTREEIEQKRKIEEKKKMEKEKLAKKKKISRIKWPSISYGGIIKNNTSGKKVILITIDNKEHLMESGDAFMEVTLKEVFRDSIYVNYLEEEKTVFIEEENKRTRNK